MDLALAFSGKEGLMEGLNPLEPCQRAPPRAESVDRPEGRYTGLEALLEAKVQRAETVVWCNLV